MTGTNVVPFAGMNLPAGMEDVFNADDMAGDLYEGVSSGFGVVSIKGSKWKIKHGGEEHPVLDDAGDPKAALEVVILKASRDVSKLYYAKAYEDGDDSEPDCYSSDGKTPDTGAHNPQSASCATCTHAQWGSKITPAGKKAKACGDSRRVAVVPLGDITNDLYGGPMLLRVPAASLNDLAAYGKGMAGKGFPYNAIGTKIGFDINAAYPKLTFSPKRKLTEEELAQVAAHFQGDTLGNVLSAAVEAKAATPAPAAPKPAVSLDFEEEVAEVETAPVQKKVAKKKAAKKKAAKVEPAPAGDSLESDLDDILSDLDNLA